jgi:hypothetical protein
MVMNVRWVTVLMLEKGMPRKSDAVVTVHFNDAKAEWTHNAPAPDPALSNTRKAVDYDEKLLQVDSGGDELNAAKAIGR